MNKKNILIAIVYGVYLMSLLKDGKVIDTRKFIK